MALSKFKTMVCGGTRKVRLPKSLLLFSAVVVVSGCQKPPAPAKVVEQPTFQPPTATEGFNLRSKCVEPAEKINGDHDLTLRYLTDQTKEPPLPLAQEQFSRYNPKTNRCYVELRVTPRVELLAMLPKRREEFLQRFEIDFMQRYLYDGQTGEELVSMSKGIKTVAPFGLLKNDKVSWSEASAKIDEIMADDRKQ